MFALPISIDTLSSIFSGPTGVFGLYAASFVVCVASGFIPFVNAEAYLLAAATLTPPGHIIPLTVTATVGQMTAKAILFYGGSGALRLPGNERWKDRVDRAHERVMAWPGGTSFALFCSASLGIPPFYVVSIVAGALRVSFASFLVLGFAGRFIRFGVVCALPLLVRTYYP